MNRMELLSSFGQRVKHARITNKLTQKELANGIANITGSKTKKGLISQWERGVVENPQNSTMMALQAVTGFALEWLVSGTGPERVSPTSLLVAEPKAVYGQNISRAMLRRSIIIAASEQTSPEAIADAAIEIVETLADEPGIPDAVLKRIARLAKTGP